MLCVESLERRWRRIERRMYWVRERSVCRIDNFRFSVWFGFAVLGGEEARSSTFSIFIDMTIVHVSESPIRAKKGEERSADSSCSASCHWLWRGVILTWLRTLSIILSINGSGHGNTSDTPLSATQKRVRSWRSRAAVSGDDADKCSRSTEARISSILSISIFLGLSSKEAQCNGIESWICCKMKHQDSVASLAERRDCTYFVGSLSIRYT